MFIEYNPNPVANKTRDCAVRAVSAALDLSWDDASDMIYEMSKAMGETMDHNAAWGAVLRRHGFMRYIVPNFCPDCYTVREFAVDHPYGIYVINTSGHVTTVIDGDIYDAWDTSNEIPIFYWHKED